MKPTKNLFISFLIYFVVPFFSQAWADDADIDSIDTSRIINIQKSNSDIFPKKDTAKTALNSFQEQYKKQNLEFKELQSDTENISFKIKETQKRISKIIQELDKNFELQYKNLSSAELEEIKLKLSNNLQSIQQKYNQAINKLAQSRSLFDNAIESRKYAQTRVQEITKNLSTGNFSINERDDLGAELNYLNINIQFNDLLLQKGDELIQLEENNKNLLDLRQKSTKRQLEILQKVLNLKKLDELTNKIKNFDQSNAKIVNSNYFLQEELNKNKNLSNYLIEQTKIFNSLSQEAQQTRDRLDTLIQVEQLLQEQLDSLQGSLAISRIINKQKKIIPATHQIDGINNSIANLREQIFEYRQNRDDLLNMNKYIASISEHYRGLNENEEIELENILKDRRALLDEILRTLNNQLNLYVRLQNDQNQAIALSDQFQKNLQRQSFWIQSNPKLNFDWLLNFPSLFVKEINALAKYFSIKNFNFPANLINYLSVMFILFLIILWKQNYIKKQLTTIAKQVNTLSGDSQFHSPISLLWTIVLIIPSTLVFTAIIMMIMFFIFNNAESSWKIGSTLIGYWMFFSTLLAILRPHGLAVTHFGLPQESNKIFKNLIVYSIVMISVFTASSIASRVDSIGFENDVIGQISLIIVLVYFLYFLYVKYNITVEEHLQANSDASNQSKNLYKILKIGLMLITSVQIGLIIFGFYYTAMTLGKYLIDSYLICLVWFFGRYFIYRAVAISSRRMTYRRLLDTRQIIREQTEQGLELTIEEPVIKTATVNKQLFRIVDVLFWFSLIGVLYWIWSDLFSVLYHLDNIVLWQSIEGDKVEIITLLNLLRSVFYTVITFVLARNMAGLLEILIFSRIKLSKGTPQTITTFLTYIVVIIGTIASFSSLGISWKKVELIFTAISVGLGFGVREIFGSFVSGAILLFERPIRVGDKVTVMGHEGFVSKIRLRSTTIVDLDNLEVVLPNQAFVTNRFINWTLSNNTSRLQILLNIDSNSDLILARELILQAIKENDKILQDPIPEVNLLGVKDNAIEHEILFFVLEIDDRTPVTNFLYYRINQLFKRNNIGFAFKQIGVHINNPINKPML